MLPQLSDFRPDKAGADILLVYLAEFCLVVQQERNWLETLPDAVVMIVDSNDTPLNLTLILTSIRLLRIV